MQSTCVMFHGKHHAFHRWVLQEKVRLEKAAVAKKLQMDGADGTTTAPSLKDLAKADIDMEAEDIDEETELMYAQAVALVDAEEMIVDEGEEEDDEEEKESHAGEDNVEIQDMAPKHAGRGCSSEAPVFSSPRGGARSSVGRGGGRGKAKAMPEKNGLSPACSAAAAPIPISLPCPGQSLPAASRASFHNGWEKLVSVEELDLKVATCSVLKAPKSLKDGKKWSVEVAKMLPFLNDLQSMLSSTSQVTNQAIKSGLTSFKSKCNDKIDKRVGYDTGKSDALSKRCIAFRTIMENCKDLRALCLVARHIFILHMLLTYLLFLFFRSSVIYRMKVA